MTSSHRLRRPLDPNEVATRGHFVNELLSRLHSDLDTATAFATRNPQFKFEVWGLTRAIQVLHDTYKFEEFMPHLDFYKQEIDDAHRTIHVDRDGPIPDPVPDLGGSRNPRATGNKRRKNK